MSSFELEDVPGYVERFPQLAGKKPIGTGEFSLVFDGTRADTVLKLTNDAVYLEFIRMKSGTAGLPKLVQDYGVMEGLDGKEVGLVEITRLLPLRKWSHDDLILEREAISGAVSWRVAMSEVTSGMMPCQQCHAEALREVRASKMFSKGINRALDAIADYMDITEKDVLLDLGNLSNYMTDGKRLIITDPLMEVM